MERNMPVSREVKIIKHCDMCRTTEGNETLELTFDGRHYETDLCPTHVAEARAALAPYLKAAFSWTLVAGTKKAEKDENRRMRAWARDNGYQMPGRGPIPDPVRQAYQAAQIDATTPGKAKKKRAVAAKKHPGGGSMAKAMAVADPEVRLAMREYAARTGRRLGRGLIPRDVQAGYYAEQQAAS